MCWAAAGCALSPGECPHSGPPTLICSLHPRGPDPAGPSGLSRPRRLQYPLLGPEGRGCAAVGEGLRGRSFEPPIVWAFFWAAPRDHQVRVMGKVGCSPGGRQVTRSSLGPPGARPSPPRAPGSSEGPVLSSRAPPEGIQRLWLWLEPLPEGCPSSACVCPGVPLMPTDGWGGAQAALGSVGLFSVSPTTILSPRARRSAAPAPGQHPADVNNVLILSKCHFGTSVNGNLHSAASTLGGEPSLTAPGRQSRAVGGGPCAAC